ncbi:MBL fold metallo-hydrolase [Congregibacter sp.]|nr:MBL fold metallo-hydrolase [Congregibacter sp.]MDA8962002.1 MBL fold metallo-hydrolase [Congregibacter sp.]
MKPLAIVVGVLAVLAASFATFRDDIALALFQRAIAKQVSGDLLVEYPSGLHVASCGSGTPLPDQTMAGACTAVIAGGRLLVFDMGDGASETMARMGLNASRIEALFLTHFHSDHIAGLGSLVMQQVTGGAELEPLRLYGPKGVEKVAQGFNSAFSQDHASRIDHHKSLKLSSRVLNLEAHAFEVPSEGRFPVVYQSEGLVVRSFVVPHGSVQSAVGYRIEFEGVVLVISGDTKASTNLVAAAQGADLLIHEALNREMVAVIEQEARALGQLALATTMRDIQTYHATPLEAAKAAAKAQVKALAFTHMIPPLPVKMLERPFLAGVRKSYSGPITVMRDGMVLSISKQREPASRELL